MGSASSRMSASPALIQPTTATSSPPSTSPMSMPDHSGDIQHDVSPSTHVIRSEPAMKPSRLLQPDPKGKGKQRAGEDKEEGEISEVEERTDRRIRGIDSWRPPPPSSSSIYRPAGSVLPRGRQRDSPPRRQSVGRTTLAQRSGNPSSSANPSNSLRGTSPSSTSNSARRTSHVSTTTAASTTLESPPSDSLSLPSGVNSDEAEQYMDIIRNLILSGIEPEILIKRGATRKYITAVCKEIVQDTKRQSAMWTETRERDDRGTPETAVPAAGPSGLPRGLRSPSPEAVDMARDASSASHSSLEVNDEIDRMLSPPQPQKLVPSSSWAPVRPVDAISRSAPSIRTESYRPVSQSAFANSATVATRPPAAPSISDDSTSFQTRPRPVSSYVPTGMQRTLDPSAPAFSPHAATRVTPATADAGANTPSSPASISETLAERKRRVLESMKRARKPYPLSSAPNTGTATPNAIVEDATPTPPILATTPKLASNSTLQDEVAALEREVMQLQENRPPPPIQLEPEEGEILASNTPSPAMVSQPLPTQQPPKPFSNGIRLNRATKRPHAEDLMEGRATSAKAPYPTKRRFGRPIGWAKLQVSLDDSDDEDSPSSPITAVAVPVDSERAKLEEDIRLLKAQIEKRRAARVKASNTASSTPPPISEVKAPAPKLDDDIVMKETWDPEETPTATIVSTPAPIEPTVSAALPPDIVTPVNPFGSIAEKPGSDPPSPASDEVVMTPATSSATQPLTFIFREYRSLLQRYPLLPTPSNLPLSLPRFTLPSSTISLAKLEQRLLSSIILTRVIKRNPNAVMCSAEAAGGICADHTCSDLHLAKILGRPDEDALLEYLLQVTEEGKTDRDDLVTAFAQAKKSLSSRIKSDQGGNGQNGRATKPISFSLQVAEQLVIKVGQLLHQSVNPPSTSTSST